MYYACKIKRYVLQNKISTNRVRNPLKGSQNSSMTYEIEILDAKRIFLLEIFSGLFIKRYCYTHMSCIKYVSNSFVVSFKNDMNIK